MVLNLKYGIHHVVNDGNATDLEITLEIASILNLNKDLIISTLSTQIPNLDPICSSSGILESIYSFNKIRNWRESLKEYVELYNNNNNKLQEIKIENKNTKQELKWFNRDKCRLCNNNNLKIF